MIVNVEITSIMPEFYVTEIGLLELIEIPYHSNPEILFSKIAHLPGAVWLDSGCDLETRGQFDIFSALPDSHFTPSDLPSGEQPFAALQNRVDNLTNNGNVEHNLPFTHGYIGYFTYDIGVKQLTADHPQRPFVDVPEFIWAHYTHAFVFDHNNKTAFFCFISNIKKTSLSCLTDIIENYQQFIHGKNQQDAAEIENKDSFCLETLEPVWDYHQYKNAFDKIKHHITVGDIYQANLTQMFAGKFCGNPYHVYSSLRQHMPAPFGAYLNFGNTKILSFSPESFLEKHDNFYTTEPIKGTIKRWKDTIKDDLALLDLKNSEKDQAENLMIVDLLRNDLSKNAVLEGVSVPEIFKLKTFSNVHHLVSKITAKTKNSENGMQIFADCFPGGSITGAPKKRSVEIIQEIEPYCRGVYCGSIGYINSAGDFKSNIAIRTITCQDQHIVLSGGGGIVSDSEVIKEYEESLTKINRLISGLKSFNQC